MVFIVPFAGAETIICCGSMSLRFFIAGDENGAGFDDGVLQPAQTSKKTLDFYFWLWDVQRQHVNFK